MVAKHIKPESELSLAERTRDTWMGVCDFFNDVYRVAAYQDGLPAACKRRDCRTNSRCQAEHVLGGDCAAPVGAEIFDRMLRLVDYRMMLFDAINGDAVEDNREGIRKIFGFLVAEIAFRDAGLTQENKERLTRLLNVHKRAQTGIIAESDATRNRPST